MWPGLLHDFADFFDFPKISRHVKMMQMHEFLAKEALTGQLRNGLLPPNNQTIFDRKRPLWTYIRRYHLAPLPILLTGMSADGLMA